MHSYTKNKKNFSGEVNWVHQALIDRVHEKVHLRTRSRNVNIEI